MVISSDATANYVTAAEFLTHPAASGPGELVRGIIRVMTPASGIHGIVAGRVFAAINTFVESNGLGQTFPDNTGFELDRVADTVRSPDAAFVREDRLPPDGIGAGWVTATPDLIVEILSPSETPADLQEKLDDYRNAGTRVAWIVDPMRRTVTIRMLTDSADSTAESTLDRVFTESDTVDGAPALTGLMLPVVGLFAGLAK